MYRNKCLHTSQKQIVESDQYLQKLYRTKSPDLISQLRIQKVAETFIDQTINVIGFDHYSKSNALDLLKWIAAIYINPMYEFQLKTERLLHGFDSLIKIDEVTEVEAINNYSGYSVHTKNASYLADYVVVATEPWVTKRLLSMNTREPTYSRSHVRRVVGTPKGIAATKKRYLCFPSGKGILSITKLSDKSFLVYTNSKSDDISEYFTNYEVIFERTWDPSFTFCSHELVESEYKKNLYIAGDINFAGIEDSALSGVCAANKIIESL